jgi:hypothetical protein
MMIQAITDETALRWRLDAKYRHGVRHKADTEPSPYLGGAGARRIRPHEKSLNFVAPGNQGIQF